MNILSPDIIYHGIKKLYLFLNILGDQNDLTTPCVIFKTRAVITSMISI